MTFLRLTTFSCAACLIVSATVAAEEPQSPDFAKPAAKAAKRPGAKAAKRVDLEEPLDLETLAEPIRKTLLKKFDANGDGALDADEQEAAKQEIARFRDRAAGPKKTTPKTTGAKAAAAKNAPSKAAAGPFDLDSLPEPLKNALRKKFDADGDGTLDPEEQDAARQNIAKFREAAAATDEADKAFDLDSLPEPAKKLLLKKFDANGNGELEPEERAAAKKEIRKFMGAAKGGKGKSDIDAAQKKLLAKYDLNKDGTLDADEQAAAQKDAQKKVKALTDQMPPAMKDKLMKQMQQKLKEFDADGDGKLSPEEMENAKAAFKDLKGFGGFGSKGKK